VFPYNVGMSDSQDMNQTAARVVAESTEKHEKSLPDDLEAAWAEWSKGIQKVDGRLRRVMRQMGLADRSTASLASS